MIDVGIVNYGAGNIASVMKAVDYTGANPVLVSNPEELSKCDRLVLPGVGASELAMSKLKESALDQALHSTVIEGGKPFMGICVGMQLLAEDLYEFGHHKGLGWIKGQVISLQDKGVQESPVPHMGWSHVDFRGDMDALSGKLGRNKDFYFCHGFTLATEQEDIVVATAQYEEDLVAGISFDNVCAFQFHPEKSQVAGDLLMQWFVDWSPS